MDLCEFNGLQSEFQDKPSELCIWTFPFKGASLFCQLCVLNHVRVNVIDRWQVCVCSMIRAVKRSVTSAPVQTKPHPLTLGNSPGSPGPVQASEGEYSSMRAESERS